MFSELSTPRIRLRAADKSDISEWFSRATDRESAAFAGDPVPNSISEGENWLERISRRREDGVAFHWVVDWLERADSIGTVSLAFYSTSGASLGFVIGRRYWGHGVATEAAHMVIAFATKQLGLKELSAIAVTHNHASIAVLLKLGFEQGNSYTDTSDGERCQCFRKKLS